MLVDDGSDHDHDSHIMVWQLNEKRSVNLDQIGLQDRTDHEPSKGVQLEQPDVSHSHRRSPSIGMEVTESLTVPDNDSMTLREELASVQVEQAVEEIPKVQEAVEEANEPSSINSAEDATDAVQAFEPKEDFTQLPT